VGYVPEDPSHPVYDGLLNDMGDLLDYCYRDNGQWFLFETGQETPAALLRLFQDLGRPNVGVNYDTGNLILYGKANPVDGLDVIGQYVRDVHAKDGEYPTDGYALGKEVPLGEGKVDFCAVIAKLKALDYDGAITIECELRGDVRPALWQAKRLLEPLLT
jgi:sugar phosphate isomerase/epimerase